MINNIDYEEVLRRLKVYDIGRFIISERYPIDNVVNDILIDMGFQGISDEDISDIADIVIELDDKCEDELIDLLFPDPEILTRNDRSGDSNNGS